jgi:hypothetical protein
VLPPLYLSVPNFRQCTNVTQMGTSSVLCLPATQPFGCSLDSWRRLQGMVLACAGNQGGSSNQGMCFTSCFKYCSLIVSPSPQLNCAPNVEQVGLCGNGCEPTCTNTGEMCQQVCREPMCVCASGLVRDTRSGQCVQPAMCNASIPGQQGGLGRFSYQVLRKFWMDKLP